MKNSMKYLYIGLIVLALAIGLAAGKFLLVDGGLDNEAVAKVNGATIDKNDLYDFMVKQSGVQALDMLIVNEIAEQEAAKKKITVSEEEISKEVEELYGIYGGEAAVVAELEKSGLTMEDLRNDVMVNLKLKKLLAERIEIPEEEMLNYFEENKDLFAQEEKVKASHILVDTLEKANEVKDKLNAGQHFTDLVNEYSTDEATKATGGDLGYFTRGMMTQAFEEAAFSMEIGEISDPISTEFGYHVILVEDKMAAQEPNYENSKEDVKDALLEEKLQTEYEVWRTEMFSTYKIENYLTAETPAEE
ncbi:MAG: peptidylprolyl isomerase [Clostridia bacterium]|jgi:foldase protein PrsA|nr:peptidylprolyl isomerase [Clostridia bacterium]